MLHYECICDRTAKFHKKILFNTRVINIQILTTKYFSFQYSVTYCSQALRRPAHRARETVHLLTHETPDFITPALWPANSPDLNPVDYQISGKLQERVYRSQIRDVDQLKSRLDTVYSVDRPVSLSTKLTSHVRVTSTSNSNATHTEDKRIQDFPLVVNNCCYNFYLASPTTPCNEAWNLYKGINSTKTKLEC